MPAPIVRFRIDFSDGCGVSPANIDLLEAIRSVGSLSQGARSLGMSYRRARLLIDGFKGAFSQPVTRAVRGGAGGGGVMLTEFGEELVDSYRRLEREIGSLATRRLQSISSSVAYRSGLKPLHQRRPAVRRV
jgi:molybdate transport system regulatory protein